MAFSVRETIYGLQHLRLKACRKLFSMKPDSYLSRYERFGIPIEICLDVNGQPICCELCGFVLIRAHLQSGWLMEMCSAQPLVRLDRPSFQGWLTTLTATTSDCQTRNFEPILHD